MKLDQKSASDHALNRPPLTETSLAKMADNEQVAESLDDVTKLKQNGDGKANSDTTAATVNGTTTNGEGNGDCQDSNSEHVKNVKSENRTDKDDDKTGESAFTPQENGSTNMDDDEEPETANSIASDKMDVVEKPETENIVTNDKEEVVVKLETDNSITTVKNEIVEKPEADNSSTSDKMEVVDEPDKEQEVCSSKDSVNKDQDVGTSKDSDKTEANTDFVEKGEKTDSIKKEADTEPLHDSDTKEDDVQGKEVDNVQTKKSEPIVKKETETNVEEEAAKTAKTLQNDIMKIEPMDTSEEKSEIRVSTPAVEDDDSAQSKLSTSSKNDADVTANVKKKSTSTKVAADTDLQKLKDSGELKMELDSGETFDVVQVISSDEDSSSEDSDESPAPTPTPGVKQSLPNANTNTNANVNSSLPVQYVMHGDKISIVSGSQVPGSVGNLQVGNQVRMLPAVTLSQAMHRPTILSRNQVFRDAKGNYVTKQMPNLMPQYRLATGAPQQPILIADAGPIEPPKPRAPSNEELAIEFNKQSRKALTINNLIDALQEFGLDLEYLRQKDNDDIENGEEDKKKEKEEKEKEKGETDDDAKEKDKSDKKDNADEKDAKNSASEKKESKNSVTENDDSKEKTEKKLDDDSKEKSEKKLDVEKKDAKDPTSTDDKSKSEKILKEGKTEEIEADDKKKTDAASKDIESEDEEKSPRKKKKNNEAESPRRSSRKQSLKIDNESDKEDKDDEDKKKEKAKDNSKSKKTVEEKKSIDDEEKENAEDKKKEKVKDSNKSKKMSIDDEEKETETKSNQKKEAEKKSVSKDEEMTEKEEKSDEKKAKTEDKKEKKSVAEKSKDDDDVVVVEKKNEKKEEEGKEEAADHKEVAKKLRPVAKFLYFTGLDFSREVLYSDLVCAGEKKHKAHKLRGPEIHDLQQLKKLYHGIRKRNQGLRSKKIRRCKTCPFVTPSKSVLHFHQQQGHMDDRTVKWGCALCEFECRVVHQFIFHMESEHAMKAYPLPKPQFFNCSLCYYTSSTRAHWTKHMLKCEKQFVAEKHQFPTYDDINFIFRALPGPLIKVPVAAPPKLKTMPAQQIQSRPGQNQRFQVLPPGAIPIVPQNYVQQRPSSQAPIRSYYQQTTTIASKPPPLKIGQMIQQQQPAGKQQYISQMPQLKPGGVQISSSSSPIVIGGASTSIQSLAGVKRTANQPLPLPSAKAKSSKYSYEVCEICGGFVLDRSALRLHFSMAHNIQVREDTLNPNRQPPLACDFCAARFWTFQGLSLHKSRSNHVRADQALCHICNSLTSDMPQHIKTAHNIVPNQLNTIRICPICGKAILTEKTEAHIERVHNIKLDKPGVQEAVMKPTFKCYHCAAKFTEKSLLQMHIRKEHFSNVSNMRKCPICKSLVVASKYKLHVLAAHCKRKLAVKLTRCDDDDDKQNEESEIASSPEMEDDAASETSEVKDDTVDESTKAEES